MDGIRLMDQINPLDQRRGFADVEFETTIIPIWLVRANYSLPVHSRWLQNLGFEFVDEREYLVPAYDQDGVTYFSKKTLSFEI